MRNNFINIGNQTFVDACKIKYIVSADHGKVARLLNKYGIKRDDIRVFDTTSNKETRSFLVLDDGTFGISSVNANTLCDRANSVERVVRKKNTGTKKTVMEDDSGEMEAMGGCYDEDEYWEALPNSDNPEGL